MKASELTDYFIYDRANDWVLHFDNGGIIFYGCKQEAEEDLYGNEEVLSYDDLPPNWKKVIENELKKSNGRT